MDSFLKFLEENCPGDDAHSGLGDPKPLLERCGMCASIYEAHEKSNGSSLLENRALIAAMREALMRPENWREAINTALNDLDPARKADASRKLIAHCYVGAHCHYLVNRNCMCLCSACVEAKKADH